MPHILVQTRVLLAYLEKPYTKHDLDTAITGLMSPAV